MLMTAGQWAYRLLTAVAQGWYLILLPYKKRPPLCGHASFTSSAPKSEFIGSADKETELDKGEFNWFTKSQVPHRVS